MKKTALICRVMGLGLSVTAVGALAHHSFSAEFDANKPLKVTGTVTKLEWQNPHTWFYVDVKDDGGSVANWGFELASPNLLLRNGWTRSSMKVGDVVTVEAYPGEERPQYRECARRHVGGDGQDVAHGLEQRE